MPGPTRAVADAMAWLLGSQNTFMVGQIIFIDGGADAVLRSDEPFAAGITYPPAALARMVFWSVVARLRRIRSTGNASEGGPRATDPPLPGRD